MNESKGYAVFFFPPALEALGEAVKPYLQDGPAGPHVLCAEFDAGGPLIEMTLAGHTADGRPIDLELMVPTNMVRMVVSARSDGAFGFGPREVPVVPATVPAEPGPAEPAVSTPPAAEAQAPAKAPAKPAEEPAGDAAGDQKTEA